VKRIPANASDSLRSQRSAYPPSISHLWVTTPHQRLSPFARVFDRYSTFARKLRRQDLLKNVRDTFERKEAEFRSTVDMSDVDASDRAALEDFRKSLGLPEWAGSGASTSRPSKRRISDSPSQADDEVDEFDFSPATKASTGTRMSGRSRVSRLTERSERTFASNESGGEDDDDDDEEDSDRERMRGVKSQRSASSAGRSFTTVDGGRSDDDDEDTDDGFSRKMKTQSSRSVASRSTAVSRSSSRRGYRKKPPPLRRKLLDEDSSHFTGASSYAGGGARSGSKSVGSASRQSKSAGSASGVPGKRSSPRRASQLSGITTQLLSQGVDSSDEDSHIGGHGGIGDDDDDDDMTGYGGEESHEESTTGTGASSPAKRGGVKRSRPIARRRSRRSSPSDASSRS
jgi:hypothetical protein